MKANLKEQQKLMGNIYYALSGFCLTWDLKDIMQKYGVSVDYSKMVWRLELTRTTRAQMDEGIPKVHDALIGILGDLQKMVNAAIEAGSAEDYDMISKYEKIIVEFIHATGTVN